MKKTTKDVIVFKVHHSREIKQNRVRVSEEAAQCLAAVQRETGLSASKIASDFILFGYDHYEVED